MNLYNLKRHYNDLKDALSLMRTNEVSLLEIRRSFTRFNKDKYSNDVIKMLNDIEQVRHALHKSYVELDIPRPWATNPAERRKPMRVRIRETIDSISTSSVWGKFIFTLICELKPIICLEIGTGLGMGTMYVASGLMHNGFGQVISFDGNIPFQKIALQSLSKIGLDGYVHMIPGLFQETLVPTISRIPQIDFAFIDGYHEEEPTIEYFEMIWPKLNPK